jgi:uncharacterized protein YoaH (UPF0181 family)
MNTRAAAERFQLLLAERLSYMQAMALVARKKRLNPFAKTKSTKNRSKFNIYM